MPANKMMPSSTWRVTQTGFVLLPHGNLMFAYPAPVVLTQDHSYLDPKQTLPPTEVRAVYLHQRSIQPVVEMNMTKCESGARCQCWAVVRASHSDRSQGLPFPEVGCQSSATPAFCLFWYMIYRHIFIYSLYIPISAPLLLPVPPHTDPPPLIP